MNPMDFYFEGLEPDVYLATLFELAHSDGLHDLERVMLEERAAVLGVDLSNLPDVPEDLSGMPWATRVLVYRDAIVLAYADGEKSVEETTHLEMLRQKLAISETRASEIEQWVGDQSDLLDRFAALLSAES